MVKAQEVIPYLLQLGLLTPEEAVIGDLTVVESRRRHHVIHVTRLQGTGLLLKQATTAANRAMIAREAAMYETLLGVKGFERHIPRLYGYNPEDGVLITERIPGAQTLREHFFQRNPFARGLADSLGTALAKLHHHPQSKTPSWRADLPLALHLPLPHARFVDRISHADLRLLEIIQQFPEFALLLAELKDEWKPETLIHGDLKWDNCLRQKGGRSRVFLIDWELGGLGDPSWDVGSVFADYLTTWLSGIPVTSDAHPERLPDLAPWPLERMHPAMWAFWQSYVVHGGWARRCAEARLRQAVRYAAARLVQTAFEMLQRAVRLSGTAVCLLQLSFNMLTQPEDAAEELLGLSLRGMNV